MLSEACDARPQGQTFRDDKGIPKLASERPGALDSVSGRVCPHCYPRPGVDNGRLRDAQNSPVANHTLAHERSARGRANGSRPSARSTALPPRSQVASRLGRIRPRRVDPRLHEGRRQVVGDSVELVFELAEKGEMPGRGLGHVAGHCLARLQWR